jgi:hypothetical protein
MLTNPQHAVQFDFLRALGGRLRKSISKLVMLREFGTRNPCWHTNNGLNVQCGASGTRWLIAGIVILQIGSCMVLAMRENAQLVVSVVDWNCCAC